MSTGINKDNFKKLIKSRQTASAKDLQFFNTFFFLNESKPLPPDLEKNRKAGLDKLQASKPLKEQYYLFHLLQTIDTKWKSFDVFTIVTQYYKSSETLKDILKELI